MSTKTTKPVVKIDNGNQYSKVYSKDKVDQLIASLSGGSKLYRHLICITGDNSNNSYRRSYIYLTLISTINLTADSVANLNILLGPGQNSFSCTGVVADGANFYSVIDIFWNDGYDSSSVEYFDASNEYGYGSQDFTNIFTEVEISDTVTTLY